MLVQRVSFGNCKKRLLVLLLGSGKGTGEESARKVHCAVGFVGVEDGSYGGLMQDMSVMSLKSDHKG